MPTTTPDDLVTPDLDNNYALVQDMAGLATKVQSALTRRANSYVGPGVDRVAFTDNAPDGTLWQDSDTQKILWRKDGGSWTPATGVITGTSTQRTNFPNPPQNVIWVDSNGDQQTWVRKGSAWKVWPLITKDTASNVLTLSSGWALASSSGATATVRGNVAMVSLYVKRTGGTITSPASGNIVNQQIGTLAADLRPAINVGGSFSSFGRLASSYLQTNGSVWLTNHVPNVNILTNAEFAFTFTYILPD